MYTDQMRKDFVLYIVGGAAYYLIEILYRGHSHYSMFLLGGVCFLLIGSLNEYVFSWQMPLNSQMTLSALAVTILEFVCGLTVNLLLGLNVWDYSSQPYNLLGQICLLYTCFWYLLSLPAILLDDLLRDKWFGEPKKQYIWF